MMEKTKAIKIGDVMKKPEAIAKFNDLSKIELDGGNTRFANIRGAEYKHRKIWWVEVPKEKFSDGFYFLFRYPNGTLIFLELPPNALNLELLYYRKDRNIYSLYVCSNKGNAQYMHDLRGEGKVDLTKFIVDCFD